MNYAITQGLPKLKNAFSVHVADVAFSKFDVSTKYLDYTKYLIVYTFQHEEKHAFESSGSWIK